MIRQMQGVSIIIPTLNSAKTIAACLSSIRRQTTPCSEVLVIDRFSSDGSAETARRLGATVVEAGVNRSLARNIGLRHASAPNVLFVDSDMTLPTTLIEECQSELNKHQALVIPEISVGKGFWAECKSLERKAYHGDNLMEAARCFTKPAILSVGGYDPSLEAGEDWDLQYRIENHGYSVGRAKSTIVHDEGVLALPAILRKKYVYGKSVGRYVRKHPHRGIRQVNPLYRILSLSPKAIRSDPIHGLGAVLLKSLEFTCAGIGALNSTYRG